MRDHPKSNASGLRQSPSVCARVSAGAFAMKPWHESWRRVSVRPVAWVEFSATWGSRSLSIGAGLSRCRCEGSRGWPCVWPYHEFYCDPQSGGMSVGSGRAAMPLALCPSLLIPPPGCSSRGQLIRPHLSLAYSAPTQCRLLIAYSRNQGTALMHAEEEDEVAPPWLGGLRGL